MVRVCVASRMGTIGSARRPRVERRILHIHGTYPWYRHVVGRPVIHAVLTKLPVLQPDISGCFPRSMCLPDILFHKDAPTRYQTIHVNSATKLIMVSVCSSGKLCTTNALYPKSTPTNPFGTAFCQPRAHSNTLGNSFRQTDELSLRLWRATRNL